MSENDDNINEEIDQADAPASAEADAEDSSSILETIKPIEKFSEAIDDAGILDALEKLSFITPTPVQAATIPRAMKGRDLVVQAKTGSGKTLAFALPLLARMAAAKRSDDFDKTYGLVIAPTRELAQQVHDVINLIDPSCSPVCLIGGVDIGSQEKGLKKDRRVVVGTPGRILDHIRKRTLSLKHCEYFALDEADEMLSMGFLEDVRAILSRLPDKRQGLFVSATISPRVDMIANSFLTKPEQVIVDIAETDLPPVEHFYCEVVGDLLAKPHLLCDLVETLRPSSAIIFCNTKSDTLLVEALLRRRGFDARRINSDLTQGQRQLVMRKIKAREIQFLVATDIAARGIDIEQIELVINYTIHEQPELYIHRTGRTGRAGRNGRAISLVGPRDFGSFHYLTKALDIDFKKIELPSNDEVANARLAHLYEMLRTSSIEVKDADLLVAEKFIREFTDDKEPLEEFVGLISKLCRHTIEHNIELEAASIEDEFDSKEEKRKSREKDDSRRERKGRDGDRGDRRGRDDKRRGSDRNSRGRDDRKSDKRDDDRGERPRRSDDDTRKREPRETEIRVYVGQGTSHGLTPDVFAGLAAEHAKLERDEFKTITIREHYGFIDTTQRNATTLCEKLNGIEHNKQTLPVEIATALNDRRQRPPRSGGNRSSGSSRKRSDENRGNR